MKRGDRVKIFSVNEKYDFLNQRIGIIKQMIPSLYKGQTICKVLFEKYSEIYIRKEFLVSI